MFNNTVLNIVQFVRQNLPFIEEIIFTVRERTNKINDFTHLFLKFVLSLKSSLCRRPRKRVSEPRLVLRRIDYKGDSERMKRTDDKK